MSSGETADEAAKRQRVSRACDLCRRKKIKCDGLSPVCSNCQAFSLECSYNDTTKKRGPPKGYIEAIENRLHKLEQILSDLAENTEDPRSQAVLAELHQPLETATGEQISTRPVRRGRGSNKNRTFFWQSNTGSNSNKKSKKRSRASPPGSPASSPQLMESPTLGHAELSPNSPSGSTVGGADDSNGQLSMDETGQVRYLGKSSGFYLLQNSRTYQNGAFHLTNCGHIKAAFNSKPSTPLDKFELPPRDLSMHLIRTYFTHYYPVLPLFYKRLLHSSMDPPSDNISPLLLNAIYAVASRISPDLRVRSDPSSPDTAGDIYFERAKCLLDDYYDTPKISTVQALLLMAMHQHGAMNSPRAWLYSGLAFRMAQDLGLHRNCDHWNIPPDERERRKRVFWCCFIVDRLFSALFGRASVFEERDCDVPFPSVDDDQEIEANSSSSSNMGRRPPVRLLESFIQLIKICDILGHVLKNIYYAKARHHAGTQHIDHVLSALNQQLTNWFNSMPPSLQYDTPIGNGEGCFDPPSPVSQLHLIYYTTVILLHRPFIPGGPSQTSSSSSSTSLPSYNICMSAANSILDIVSIMLSENNLKYVSNFTVYYIFTAGIIFMKSATAAADSEKSFESKVKINKIMRALDEIELTWNTASRSCNILGELAGLRDINLEFDNRENTSMPQQQPASASSNNNNNKGSMQTPPLSMAFSSPDAQNKERPEPSLQQQQSMGNSDNNNNGGWMNSNDRLPPTPLSRPPEILGNNNSNTTNNNNAYSLPTSWLPVSNTYESTAPTVDPFAAPGTIPGPAQQQFDPLGAAFWGVPPSMDMNEWNNYLGAAQMNNPGYNSNNNSGSAFSQPVPTTTTATGGGQEQQQQPLIPSHEFAPVQQPQARLPPSSLQSQQPQHQQQQLQQRPESPMQERLSINKHLIHTDDTVDVLSGVSNLTPPPRELALLNYLGATPDPTGPNGYSMSLAGTGHTTTTSSTTSSSSSRQQQQQQQQNGSSSSRDPSGLMYW